MKWWKAPLRPAGRGLQRSNITITDLLLMNKLRGTLSLFVNIVTRCSNCRQSNLHVWIQNHPQFMILPAEVNWCQKLLVFLCCSFPSAQHCWMLPFTDISFIRIPFKILPHLSLSGSLLRRCALHVNRSGVGFTQHRTLFLQILAARLCTCRCGFHLCYLPMLTWKEKWALRRPSSSEGASRQHAWFKREHKWRQIPAKPAARLSRREWLRLIHSNSCSLSDERHHAETVI